MSMIGRCTPCLSFLKREGDDMFEVWRKNALFVFLLLTVLMAFLGFINSGRPYLGVSFGVVAGLLAYLTIWRRVTDVFLGVVGFSIVILVVAMDFNSALAQATRSWAFMVVVLDVLLVSRCPRRLSTCIVATGTLGILVIELELAYRFGLMDISGLPSYASRTENFCADPHKPACPEPPCPSKSLGSSLLGIVVFVSDFLLTRAFSEKVEVEKQKIKRSIDVAHNVALQLADFNLEAASADLVSLVDCDDVPAGLLAAFRQLVENLDSYRPYLPQSCLQTACADNVENGSEGCEGYPRASMKSASSVVLSCCLETLANKPSTTLAQYPIAMLASNFVDSERLLKESPTEYLDKFDTYLTSIVAVVSRCRGIVDLLIADKAYSVFNSVVRCPSYSLAAVRAGLELKSEHPGVMNFGVSTSVAMCGVLGCASMKRFIVIGPAIRIAPHFEHCGRALGKCIVVDARTESDASVFCHFRLVPMRFMFRTFIFDANPKLMLMYEAMSLIEEETVADEWMYSLQSSTNPAASYNRLALAYLQHNFNEAEFPLPIPDGKVNPVLGELISDIKARTPPKEVTVA